MRWIKKNQHSSWINHVEFEILKGHIFGIQFWNIHSCCSHCVVLWIKENWVIRTWCNPFEWKRYALVYFFKWFLLYLEISLRTLNFHFFIWCTNWIFVRIWLWAVPRELGGNEWNIKTSHKIQKIGLIWTASLWCLLTGPVFCKNLSTWSYTVLL